MPSVFDASMVSCNADAEGGSWVEGALRPRCGARWTSWYERGPWSATLAGDHRTSLNCQNDGDGRVDTDTLVLTRTADAIQLRARFHPASGGVPPSISLLAVTSLTQIWGLYAISLVPAAFGALMGIAGLAGWAIHPTALTSLLS